MAAEADQLEAHVADVHNVIPWAELNNILGIDTPVWQPWV